MSVTLAPDAAVLVYPDVGALEDKLKISSMQVTTKLTGKEIFAMVERAIRAMATHGVTSGRMSGNALPIDTTRMALMCNPAMYALLYTTVEMAWKTLPEPIPEVKRVDMLIALLAANGYAMVPGAVEWPKANARSFGTLWIMAMRMSELLSRPVIEFLLADRDCIGFCRAVGMEPADTAMYHVPMLRVPPWFEAFDMLDATDITSTEALVHTSRTAFQRSCIAPPVRRFKTVAEVVAEMSVMQMEVPATKPIAKPACH